MADLKISELTNLTAADPANDMIPIVDVSATPPASGSTKRISINNILACSPTATLASATISGDLTVRTNKLKVDATGVAIGATSATYLLDVRGTDTTNALIAGTTKGIRFVASASTSSITGVDNTGAASYQPLSIGGSALDFSLSGTTAMTLNSTGLGIGTTVLGGNKLAIGSTSDTSATANGFNIVTNRATITTVCNGAVDAAGTTINYSYANGGQGPLIFRNATVSNVMTLDASGNVGISRASTGNKLEAPGVGIDGRATVGGVSTVATTIYTIKQSATAAMCVVYGDNGTDGFCDIVLFLATVAPKVVSSQTMYGSPAARTYSTSTTNLQLALASGTLSIRTAALSTLNT